MAKSNFFSKRAVILIIALAVVIAAAAAVILLRPATQEKAAEASAAPSAKPSTEPKGLTVHVDSCPAYMSMEDLVNKSTLVVHGRVSGRSDAFKFSPSRAGSSAGYTEIYTDVYFEPIRILKGEAEQDQLSIRILGGTVDGVTCISDSEPKLTDGTEYVLFLDTPQENDSGDKYYYVCGIDQGAFKKSGDSFAARGGGSFTLDEFADMF